MVFGEMTTCYQCTHDQFPDDTAPRAQAQHIPAKETSWAGIPRKSGGPGYRGRQ
jgi:hypothetical protein